ncbi:MAG TPA: KTSC domain-containing protein [Ignavibacteriaceae bacterium]
MKTFMKLKDSSVIESYEYDDETLNLEVEYKSGVAYRYLNVDSGTFSKLQLAESKGHFIATEVKKFDFEKLGGASINKPRPWNFPKSEDFGKEVAAAWPFPTGKKPV